MKKWSKKLLSKYWKCSVITSKKFKPIKFKYAKHIAYSSVEYIMVL